MPVYGTIARFDDSGYMRAAQVRARVFAAARAVVRSHAEMIQLHIKDNMRSAKTGRKYWRPGGRIHTASAPGEAPAVDTGKLIEDIQIKNREQPDAIFAVIGAEHTKYAAFLELGTARIKPRPFMAPAVAAFGGRFRDQIALIVSRI